MSGSSPMQIIKGYHCNDLEKTKNFIENKELVMTSENGHWLGSGMYFWDNLSTAHYWKSEKIRKDPTKSYEVCIAFIGLDDTFLDLTDLDIANKIQELWEELAKEKKWDSKAPLGLKLNLLYDAMPFFDVIKVSGSYPRAKKGNLIQYNPSKRCPQPTENSRIIYSVKSDKHIIATEVQ